MSVRIGRIDYLNIWHIFHLLAQHCPAGPDFHYVPGHPSQLNHALATGDLDISPSSSFEYLLRAEHYQLLPAASISAHDHVQSVLLLSPTPTDNLAAWLTHNPGPVLLTSASATSTALLKILWTQKWGFTEPDWQEVEPGQGIASGRPFLEIGNFALRHFVHPPSGYHCIDLAQEWTAWTDLPFVFAVWIVRRTLPARTRALLSTLHSHITAITTTLDQHFSKLSGLSQRPDWLTQAELIRYWQAMHYTLDAREQAGLALFGECCTRQGLLDGMPALRWFE